MSGQTQPRELKAGQMYKVGERVINPAAKCEGLVYRALTNILIVSGPFSTEPNDFFLIDIYDILPKDQNGKNSGITYLVSFSIGRDADHAFSVLELFVQQCGDQRA